jgi:hypothetical protein
MAKAVAALDCPEFAMDNSSARAGGLRPRPRGL